MKHLLLLIATLCVTVGTTAVHAQHKLADFRRVVVADQSNHVERAAADELSHYAGKVAGRELPIVVWSELTDDAPGLSFFIGVSVAEKVLQSPLGEWQDEEYLLRSTPRGLLLAGDDAGGDPWSLRTSAGSMLAVYTLLDDHLGVHWFWPGPFGEHVPSRPEAVIPALDVRQRPSFEIRSYELGYTRYHTKEFADSARRWARRARLGWVRSAVFGHSWFDAFNLRNDESFRAHPEWFALVDGKRRPPQMCTTNPAVIERMVEYVLAGKLDIMNISPSDGGGFCECENCRKLDVPGLLSYDNKTVQLSDRIFTYANEIARRVREKNPSRGVGMFAYTYYNRPPAKIERLEPNLYLSFVYQSAAHRNPQNLTEWREAVAGWQKLGAKMVVREGWGNHYYHDLPMLHDQQIIANLAEAKRLGFVAAYGEASKSFATQAPNYWALTRMMWDPGQDTARVMPEFYQSAYGPAAEPMEKFFAVYRKSLDANWSQLAKHVDSTAVAYANIIGVWRKLIPVSVVDEAEGHLQRAAQLVPPGEYADRVAFHRFGNDYTRVMLELLEGYRQLAAVGVKMDFFSTIEKETRDDPAERERLLKRAFELGERREEMLLAHRDWAGPDEGLYAFTVERDLRRWHKVVKAELKIDRPSRLAKGAFETR
jgi:hypothetical protein